MCSELLALRCTLGAVPPTAAFALDARSFGAKGDGAADDTEALQAVLDACGRQGGGVVPLPRGSYAVRGCLTIPEYVTLQGVFGGPSAMNEDRYTTLLAYAGRGREDDTPFLTMKTGAGARGLAIQYPEQTGPDIVPYPWCIAGVGEDVSIVDCVLVNPYQGIDVG